MRRLKLLGLGMGLVAFALLTPSTNVRALPICTEILAKHLNDTQWNLIDKTILAISEGIFQVGSPIDPSAGGLTGWLMQYGFDLRKRLARFDIMVYDWGLPPPLGDATLGCVSRFGNLILNKQLFTAMFLPEQEESLENAFKHGKPVFDPCGNQFRAWAMMASILIHEETHLIGDQDLDNDGNPRGEAEAYYRQRAYLLALRDRLLIGPPLTLGPLTRYPSPAEGGFCGNRNPIHYEIGGKIDTLIQYSCDSKEDPKHYGCAYFFLELHAGEPIQPNLRQGMLIILGAGTWKEELIIDNARHLILEGRGSGTILDGFGIYISENARVTIDGVTVKGYEIIGLGVWGQAQVTVQNSTISGSGDGYYGLYVMDSAQVTLQNSQLSGNKYGLYVGGSARAWVIGNAFLNNKSYGIWAQSTDNIVECRGNRFEGNGEGPTYPSSLADRCR